MSEYTRLVAEACEKAWQVLKDREADRDRARDEWSRMHDLRRKCEAEDTRQDQELREANEEAAKCYGNGEPNDD